MDSMAVRANPLTDRVRSTAAGGAAAPWTAPASDLRVMMDALARLGYDADALATTAGFRAVAFDDPDARVPCDAYGALVAGAQRVRFTPNLALALARVTPLGAYPLLDYLVITSDTAGAGLQQLARYFDLVGSPVGVEVRDERDPVRVELTRGAPFGVEYLASLMVLHLGAETGGRFAAAEISFQHAPDDVMQLEQSLGCPVRAGATWNGLTVTRESWCLPMRRRDPILRRLLESQADEILARLPARAGFAVDVQRALSSRVAGGDTRIGTVARQLAMSGRTLQRRLAEVGTSYQELLDEVRKEAAGRYLTGSTLAIGEVAYLVGYSEPATFHRAFKRWYGTTPEAFRRTRRPA
jgi:AraC-like DNA-binding protein